MLKKSEADQEPSRRYQFVFSNPEEERKHFGVPLNHKVLKNIDKIFSKEMSKFVRRKCGVRRIVERDGEADSWAERSHQADVDDSQTDDKKLAWKDELRHKGEVGPESRPYNTLVES